MQHNTKNAMLMVLKQSWLSERKGICECWYVGGGGLNGALLCYSCFLEQLSLA